MGILDAFGHVDNDAVHQIDKIDERLEIDGRVIIDRDAEKRLDGIGGQRRAAARQFIGLAEEIGLIDAIDAEVGNLHPQVARQRQERG